MLRYQISRIEKGNASPVTYFQWDSHNLIRVLAPCAPENKGLPSTHQRTLLMFSHASLPTINHINIHSHISYDKSIWMLMPPTLKAFIDYRTQ